MPSGGATALSGDNAHPERHRCAGAKVRPRLRRPGDQYRQTPRQGGPITLCAAGRTNLSPVRNAICGLPWTTLVRFDRTLPSGVWQPNAKGCWNPRAPTARAFGRTKRPLRPSVLIAPGADSAPATAVYALSGLKPQGCASVRGPRCLIRFMGEQPLSVWLSSGAGADGICSLEAAFPFSRTLQTARLERAKARRLRQSPRTLSGLPSLFVLPSERPPTQLYPVSTGGRVFRGCSRSRQAQDHPCERAVALQPHRGL